MSNLRSGVYRILNLRTGKVYVGSSQDVPRRLKEHRVLLRRGAHHSSHLQAAWQKDGEASFAFDMVASVPVEHLVSVEQTLINEHRAASKAHGYNMRPVAESNRGHTFGAETREKIAAANRGKKASAETREKMRNARLGKSLSLTHCKNIAAGKTGQPRGDVARWAPAIFRKFDDRKVEEIRLDRANGQTYRALAAKYACSIATVYYVINRVGFAYS